MQTFNDAEIPQQLFHRLEQLGLVKPTPIQAKAIPVALEGNDILGSAQTGTGKTAAFGVPLITHLLNNEKGAGLVLLPTRELAGQVLKTLDQFIGRSNIPSALLIGGEDMGKQIRKLRAFPRLIVGTPGRINDHLKRGTLKLDRTDFLVLDEVDRMLDMGFGVQLDAIAKFLHGERQTLMFSATMPGNIQKVSAKYLTDPVRISVGSAHATAPNVKQELVQISDGDKFSRLESEIEAREGSILIFIKTKYAAEKMAVKLKKLGHAAAALHGDLRQNKRTQVTAGFRAKKFRILVATDVAARGLDIPHIEHVINHDMPQSPEDYIHRIGRTARAGATGEAINFVSPSDASKWNAIQRLLNPGQKIEKLSGARKGGGRKSGGKKSGKSFGGKKPGGNRFNARSEGEKSFGGKKRKSFKPRTKEGVGEGFEKNFSEASNSNGATGPSGKPKERSEDNRGGKSKARFSGKVRVGPDGKPNGKTKPRWKKSRVRKQNAA
ncbi:MAG TPA: DEAD/DEAH box helicase [Devosia sp.]|nr:DEAD/DEAH box helicase [Devosia sp.]